MSTAGIGRRIGWGHCPPVAPGAGNLLAAVQQAAALQGDGGDGNQGEEDMKEDEPDNEDDDDDDDQDVEVYVHLFFVTLKHFINIKQNVFLSIPKTLS